MSEKARRGVTAASVMAWIALHCYTTFNTFFEGWYKTYTSRTWTLLGLWLFGLLALDVLLYFSGGTELLRSVKWYWGFSAALMAASLAASLLDWSFPDLLAFVYVLCSLVTPMHQLTAFSWRLFHELAGFEERSVLYGAEGTVMLLFCLLHFAYAAWLHRRAQTRGETSHGPVDPGAGTVEAGL